MIAYSPLGLLRDTDKINLANNFKIQSLYAVFKFIWKWDSSILIVIYILVTRGH